MNYTEVVCLGEMSFFCVENVLLKALKFEHDFVAVGHCTFFLAHELRRCFLQTNESKRGKPTHFAA